MLHYGIGALLIVLIITIVLSYRYNAEGFAEVTQAAKTAAAQSTGQPVSATNIISGDTESSVATPGPSSKDIAKSKHNLGTLSNKLPSQSIKVNNIDNMAKKDKVAIKAEYKGKFLRIFASMPSLADIESQIFWIISENTDAAPIWKTVIVTNDPTTESASIPPAKYEPYIGQVAYLVPRGSNNPDDAYATFIIPTPSTKPTIVNPRVELSDTGYAAMKLNKHSNLLNDIQKIIHNEMLANRSLDIVVKNANNKLAPGASVGASALASSPALAKSIAQLPPKMQEKALAQMQNNSCNGSCGGSCNSCKSSQQSDDEPDMSKYIRKDQIPCWGCSLDY